MSSFIGETPPSFILTGSGTPDGPPGRAVDHVDDNIEEFDGDCEEPWDDKQNFSPLCLVRGCRRISVIMILAMGLIALLGALAGWVESRKMLANWFTPVSARNQQTQVMKAPCGQTPDEARLHGCYFDVISFCWLPSRCYDAELSQRFERSADWEWFLDPNRTVSLTHEQIMTGEHTGLYVNWNYHLLHCISMWEKMHRALMAPHAKMAIDSYIGSYEHTKHCGHMLMSDRDMQLDVINTIILVKYPDCGIP